MQVCVLSEFLPSYFRNRSGSVVTGHDIREELELTPIWGFPFLFIVIKLNY
jgi:hypothetical protein